MTDRDRFQENEAEFDNEPVVSAMDSSAQVHDARRPGRHSNHHGHKGAKARSIKFKTRMQGATKYLDHESRTHHLVK